MEPFQNDFGNLQTMIRYAMTDILGELGAISALSYTGDTSDGNLLAFARRVYELFGLGASKILSEIVSWISGTFRKV
jgi:hypothetical protein